MPPPRVDVSSCAIRSSGVITAASRVGRCNGDAGRSAASRGRSAGDDGHEAEGGGRGGQCGERVDDAQAGTSRKPVMSVPAMPPAVFSARTRPRSSPIRSGPAARRSAAGNAAPSRSVGANTNQSAARANREHIAACSLDVAARTATSRLDCQVISQVPRPVTARRARRPAPATSRPNVPQGSARGPRRAHRWRCRLPDR